MDGVETIAAERKRQIEEEGWTAKHDDSHDRETMAMAAACYATPEPLYVKRSYQRGDAYVDPWPWDDRWDKRPGADCSSKERIRALAKAGALIAAEIDRIQRADSGA